MRRFALIGACGYIAPRHIRAINETGNKLVAAFDPHDAAGALDAYSQDVAFFTDWNEFSAACGGMKIDTVTVCSPNHLHYPQAIWAMRKRCDVIAEKPMATEAQHAAALACVEEATGRTCRTIAQLRLCPGVLALPEFTGRHAVTIDYRTPRGPWYKKSWKGHPGLSGGLLMNIGVHFFDLLLHLFGPVHRNSLVGMNSQEAAGMLTLEHADVDWYLSIAPGEPRRTMTIDGEPVDLSAGFQDLHAANYRAILDGGGVGPLEASRAIAVIEHLKRGGDK